MTILKTDRFDYLEKPNPKIFFSLIHGDDHSEVDNYCNHLSESIAGSEAKKEMRIEKFFFESFKNNFAELENSIKTLTFFSGIKVIILKNVSENLNEKFRKIIFENSHNLNTKIIATSSTLGYRSSLKKFVDDNTTCLNIFLNKNTSEKNIEKIISEFNIKFEDKEAYQRLIYYSKEVNLSEFREKLNKISLLKFYDKIPLSIKEIDSVVFLQHETEMYDMINLMIEGKVKELITSMNYYDKKINEITTTLIITNKIFLQFHKILSNKKGPEFAINSFLPPIYTKRKNQILKQIKKWDLYKIEKALIFLSEADFKIRSNSKIKYKQIFERTFINISKLA